MAFGFGFGFSRLYGAISAAFNPASLFAAGEQGTWYDVNLTDGVLFQDSAGTTPVTAVEQPVGLMLDKSKGLVLGPELVKNGEFSSASNWNLNAGWSIGSGSANYSTTGSATILSQANVFTVGKHYQVSFTITSLLAGGFSIYSGTGDILPTGQSVSGNSTGTFTGIISAASTSLVIRGGATAVGSIDNISVRELPGNHAFQTTSASRPVLSARVNLLTKTEQFDDAVWQKVFVAGGSAPVLTTNAGIAPDGTNSANKVVFVAPVSGDLSQIYRATSVPAGAYVGSVYVKADGASDVGKVLGFRQVGASAYTLVTLTSSWQRVSSTEVRAQDNYEITLRPAVGTSSGTVSVQLWGADLRVSNDALSQPAYQRVNTSTDYDTVGFKPYLAFDGVDDSLVTNSIDFTATDKMTVFAGVRKLSDAAIGMLAELSAASESNNGAFYITQPIDTTGAFRVSARGSAVNQRNYGPYAAPTTAVLSTSLSTVALNSGAAIAIRVNSVSVAGSDQASANSIGNFGNYPLYIGRRNNASLTYNGRLYSLIVRGAASTTAQITSTEAWVAGKTGVTL
jgi:hypothetical protein